MKHHFSLYCYFHSLPFFGMSLICDIHLRHVSCVILTILWVYVCWKFKFGKSLVVW